MAILVRRSEEAERRLRVALGLEQAAEAEAAVPEPAAPAHDKGDGLGL